MLITPPASQGKSVTLCDCWEGLYMLLQIWTTEKLVGLEEKTWDFFTADYTKHFVDTHQGYLQLLTEIA